MPTWHPPPGLPTQRLLVRRGDTWEVRRDLVGPGYRAAYGLVALYHHQALAGKGAPEPRLVDYRIRTHGTPAYRSILRGESNGCHRLYNHLVIRLAGFLLRHRAYLRHGPARESYQRRLTWEGQEIALEHDERGYRFELTPPVPVTVLDGVVRGSRRAVARDVPLASAELNPSAADQATRAR
jgi:hypothetical protein